LTAPPKSVVVLDHGSGNLRSAERALARAGAEVTVTADLTAAAECDGLVVPGVGAFAAVMEGLTRIGAEGTIADRLADERPVLGICVGMQVLFDEGLEHGRRTPGLGHLTGSVTHLEAPVVPHMGWNTVDVPEGSVLFAGVERERFYFVHSYAAREVPDALVTTCQHGERFAAAVERGVLWATQFHPEKSGDAGAHLLENWVGSL
jgi:glutamine amidotransferase